jgi:hypothetical protein
MPPITARSAPLANRTGIATIPRSATTAEITTVEFEVQSVAAAATAAGRADGSGVGILSVPPFY